MVHVMDTLMANKHGHREIKFLAHAKRTNRRYLLLLVLKAEMVNRSEALPRVTRYLGMH